MSHGTCSYIYVHTNEVAVLRYSYTYEFCNIVSRIKHKSCTASGSAPPIKISECSPGFIYVCRKSMAFPVPNVNQKFDFTRVPQTTQPYDGGSTCHSSWKEALKQLRLLIQFGYFLFYWDTQSTWWCSTTCTCRN